MSPEFLSAMMESPMMRQMMDSPELLNSLLNANPQTRAVMQSNPELAQALRDPETLRMMTRAASNPDYMRSMMQANDAALRNIESLPGGMAALSRMYTDVQAPLEQGLMDSMNAPSPSAGAGVPETNVPSNEPMPNPWARRPQAATATPNPFAALFPSTNTANTAAGMSPPDRSLFFARNSIL
jgi:ubiquilin